MTTEEPLDWPTLRRRSLLPAGFGDDRTHIWPRILHIKLQGGLAGVEDVSTNHPSSDSTDQHRDERQIGLDTDRSFVLYPVESVEGHDRESLQHKLHALLVRIFRRRPKLSYFQGYHDIVTVLFLTLPPELQLPCAEEMSLQRLRDAMGNGLEPVVGLLYVLKHLLRLADREYASLLEEATPIPYFALSNLLTLFSHDMPTLPLIQHVFDYLLCRPPIASVYLAASIILSRKDEALRLQKEGEEGMLHSLLSSLPDIYQEEAQQQHESASSPGRYSGSSDSAAGEDDGQKGRTISEETALDDGLSQSSSTPLKISSRARTPDATLEDTRQHEDGTEHAADVDHFDPPAHNASLDSAVLRVPSLLNDEDDSLDEKVPFLAGASDSPPPRSEALETDSNDAAVPSLVAELNNVPLFIPPPSTHPLLDDASGSRSSSPTPAPRRPRVKLSDLLTRADELFARFPPSTPALSLSQIFALNSVVHTWNEDPSLMPSSDDAEAMVEHPELVVLPYVDESDEDKEYAEELQKEKEREGEREGRRRRKLRKRRRAMVERGVVLATAIIVVGVAMAVYGTRSGGGPNGRGGLLSGMKVEQHEWRTMGRWIGGAMLGAGEWLFEGLRAF